MEAGKIQEWVSRGNLILVGDRKASGKQLVTKMPGTRSTPQLSAISEMCKPVTCPQSGGPPRLPGPPAWVPGVGEWTRAGNSQRSHLSNSSSLTLAQRWEHLIPKRFVANFVSSLIQGASHPQFWGLPVFLCHGFLPGSSAGQRARDLQ